jgi:hypothetical protein
MPAAPHRAAPELNRTFAPCLPRPVELHQCLTHSPEPSGPCPACRAKPNRNPPCQNQPRLPRLTGPCPVQIQPTMPAPSRHAAPIKTHLTCLACLTPSRRPDQSRTRRTGARLPSRPSHTGTRPNQPRSACRAPSCLDTPDHTGPNSASPALQKETRRACGARRAKTRRCWTRRALHRLHHLTQYRLNRSHQNKPRLACRTLLCRAATGLVLPCLPHLIQTQQDSSCLTKPCLACLLMPPSILLRSQRSHAIHLRIEIRVQTALPIRRRAGLLI